MADEKIIKFKFVIDQQSAQQVNKALDDMIKRAQELAKVMGSIGVGGGGGGIFGGGGVGGGGSGKSSPQSIMSKGVGATAPKSSSFGSVLTQNVEVFKKIAMEGSNASKVILDSTVRNIDQTESKLFKLEKRIESITRAHERAKKAGASNVDELERRLEGHAVQKSKLNSELSSLRAISGAGTMAGRLQGGYYSGKFARWMGPAAETGLGQGMLGLAESGEAAASMGLRLATATGGGAVLAGAGAAAGGLALGGVLAGRGNTSGLMGSGLERQQLLDAQKISHQNITGSAVMRLRAGDYSDLRAMSRIQADAEMRQNYNEILNPMARANRATGGGLMGGLNTGANAIGGVSEWSKNRGRAIASALWNEGATGGFKELFSSDTDASYYQSAQKERENEFREHIKGTENPYQKAIQEEATQNAVGKLNLMRTLGMAPKDAQGKYSPTAELFMNRYHRYGNESTMRAFGGLASGATRGLAQSQSVMDIVQKAQASGLTDIAGQAGIMGRQGGQSAQDFTARMLTMQGGGVDPTIVNQIGQYVSDYAASNNFENFGGAGLMGLLSRGTNAPNGAIVSRQNMSAFNERESVYGNNRDALQNSINIMSAIKAMPNAGLEEQRRLSNMDPKRVAEIAAGGQLTDVERAGGLKDSAVKAFKGYQEGYDTTRASSKGFTRPDTRKIYQLLEKGLPLEKAALAVRDPQRRAAAVAAILQSQGRGALSESGAIGSARDRMGGPASPVEPGTQAEEPGTTGLEAEQAGAEEKQKSEDLAQRAASAPEISKIINTSGLAYKRLARNVDNIGTLADNIGRILVDFGGKLQSVTGGAPNTKGGPKKQ